MNPARYTRAEIDAAFEQFKYVKPAPLDVSALARALESPPQPMQRTALGGRARPFIAYDFETTNIPSPGENGTPLPLYLTAYGEIAKKVTKRRCLSVELSLATEISGPDYDADLLNILETHLLTSELNGYRFIAWNANRYDVYFIRNALLRSKKYTLRPYLTLSKAIRGMRVISTDKATNGKFLEWEFLDGMSMTGLDSIGMPLKKFLLMFAPDWQKGELDFSKESFNPKNKVHQDYAMRDSVGLYHAMKAANKIVKELTGSELRPTMGNLAIRYMLSKMPEGVKVWKALPELHALCANGAIKRGGYVWAARQFRGKVWKYDLNQAYAAAMRDGPMPHGSCYETTSYVANKYGAYLVTFERAGKTLVPFYYRDLEKNIGKFSVGGKAKTWLLSTEIEHLRDDGWNVEVERGYYWSDSFLMKDMVDELEHVRMNVAGDPSDALGTTCKQLGNSAYGKTLENLDGMEIVWSANKPDDFEPYYDNEGDEIITWCKQGEAFDKPYHRPQIGAFITAHVRLLVRSAAIRDPKHFLYADTDCVMFSRSAPFLKVDAKKYGCWKLEKDGVYTVLIGKKIYIHEGDMPHSKGLRRSELSMKDMEKWYDTNQPPSQVQVQRLNIMRSRDGDMFRSMTREGTDVRRSKTTMLVDRAFVPC